MNEFFQRLPGFAMAHWWMVLLFIALLLALVATEILRVTRKYGTLTPAALTLLINREGAQVFDISSHEDFRKGHVPGAHHVPASQFEPGQGEVARARELPIVVVCKDGRASSRAAQKLVKAEFPNVHTLGGGMYAWVQADLPVETGSN